MYGGDARFQLNKMASNCVIFDLLLKMSHQFPLHIKSVISLYILQESIDDRNEIDKSNMVVSS